MQADLHTSLEATQHKSLRKLRYIVGNKSKQVIASKLRYIIESKSPQVIASEAWQSTKYHTLSKSPRRLTFLTIAYFNNLVYESLK